MIRRLARQALAAFKSQLAKRREAKAAARIERRLRIANPEIAKLQEQIAERAKRHRKVEPLRKQLHGHIVANLAREQAGKLGAARHGH